MMWTTNRASRQSGGDRQLEQPGFFVEVAFLMQRDNLVSGQKMTYHQGRMWVVKSVILLCLLMVVVGIAVPAAVDAGVVVAKSTTLHAPAAGTVAFLSYLLEVKAE